MKCYKYYYLSKRNNTFQSNMKDNKGKNIFLKVLLYVCHQFKQCPSFITLHYRYKHIETMYCFEIVDT